MKPSVLLINPWIYDFAAYDLWAKPLGLLYLAGYLRCCGFHIHLVDCLDVYHPDMKKESSIKAPVRRRHGTGKFWRQRLDKPRPLSHIQRPYSRYGLSPAVLERELRKVKAPRAILVTSLMTYWYPGVREVITLARKVHPGVPILLGGIYARLCPDHARHCSGADTVLMGADPRSLLSCLEEYGVTSPSPPPSSHNDPYPAFDLMSRIDYVCLLTSTGCPYRCRYCASHILSPVFSKRDPERVLEEILYWHGRFGVRDFAFYDDALLIGADAHLAVLLKHLERLKLDVRFHTPNAIHAKEITPEIAGLMRRCGFKTIRLGLETADFSMRQALDDKVAEGEFEQSVHYLLEAGFFSNQIGAYILVGLPGQTVDSVIKTIGFVEDAGAIPYLSEYSPIPGTGLWDEALRCSKYDLDAEPLYHNNTILPCWNETQRQALPLLKKRVMEAREKARLSRKKY